MSTSIIKVEGLGKKYIISHEQGRSYTALRDVISKKAKGLLAKNGNNLPAKEEFWALKDVNFEIKQGEAVGIIGRNGAGKSTLLKILSRITEPSTGRIEINGRVASLLEVGTGFHPELTGRENIFLNGAILGMSRAEIKRKFDEIVDFSGVEKFLDTPVKRYSSGMYVRLAFAVAAHLEPEILIVDEVLAVGDAEFQKKCLGKMQDVSAKEGRTVLFVSHNLEAIRTLCNKGILLRGGELLASGDVHQVVDEYLDFSKSNPVFEVRDTKKPLYFKNISISSPAVEYNGKIVLNCEVISTEATQYTLGVGIMNAFEKVIASTFVHHDHNLDIGSNAVTIEMPLLTLVPGDYKCILAICIGKNMNPEDVVTGFPLFTVISDTKNQEKFARWTHNWGDHMLTGIKLTP